MFKKNSSSAILLHEHLLITAHAWFCEHGFTPNIVVWADDTVNVPREFVDAKTKTIVLNVSYDATHQMAWDGHFLCFQSRFGGVARSISVPCNRIVRIFARDTDVAYTNAEILQVDMPVEDQDNKVLTPIQVVESEKPSPFKRLK